MSVCLTVCLVLCLEVKHPDSYSEEPCKNRDCLHRHRDQEEHAEASLLPSLFKSTKLYSLYLAAVAFLLRCDFSGQS